jgi:hypothetical protein
MQRWVILVLALVVAACGGGSEPPPAAPTSTAVPDLARAPKAEGELVVSGEASPESHGPFDFSGEYTVRFEQYAPEDPSLDFGGATSFVAALDREAEITGGDSIPLFEAARARQTRELAIEGRYFVDVSFGDFPYVIRFTPVDG